MDVKNSLDKFGKSVVKQSRTQLTKKKKNASKALYNSIDYDLKVSKNSFELSFSMEDYGTFVDKGVKGVGGTKADGSNWKKKKVVGSKFKYTNKKPPASAFNNWTVRKGIAPRGKGGQFTTRKGLQFAIANSVYHTGLETTNFFTRPFEVAFKQLPDELAEAYGLEVDKLLKSTLI
jgi:hypothetical protein|tara:strand:+ start:1205 stop:1732 length:528 start_codon:yes stop_codon:yes gene_type:complete